MFGKVRGDNFYFRKGQQDARFGASIFNKKFYGRIESVSNGTEITGTFTIFHFFNILYIILIIFGILVAFDSNPIGIWQVLLFLAFLIVFLYSARDNGEEQIDFIKKTLDATQES